MLRIRMIEEKLLQLVSEGVIFGTTHTSIGQEAISIGLSGHLTQDDFVFSNHRCHGHYFAYGGPLIPLLAEIMGKKEGLCGGRGGSQHIRYKRFFSNGIQGGILPNAVGLSFYQKQSVIENENITICFIGDGTLGQGLVYESMNLASIYDLPILFIVENNQYAMSTNSNDSIGGRIIDRPRSFGIESHELTTNNVKEIDKQFNYSVNYVRNKRKPYCQIINTYRLAAHSKGDDTRDSSELEYHWKFDPLKVIENELKLDDIESYKAKIADEISSALDMVNKLEDSQVPIFDDFLEQIESNIPGLLNNKYREFSEKKIVELINDSLSNFLTQNQEGYLIGEDLRDPYGGAFKVTKGLSTRFSERVINTPISEAAIVGMGIGMMLSNTRVIIEIMFGDFITLISDQVINHLSKYMWLYGLNRSNLIIRTPMGGYRGYGPTHSQSIERLFFGVPFLRIVAISEFIDPRLVYEIISEHQSLPAIVIENKILYGKKMINLDDLKIHEYNFIDRFYPLALLSSKFEISEALIISYGYVASLALDVIKEIFIRNEIIIDLLVPTIIFPLQIETLTSIIHNYKIVIILEESNIHSSWADSVIGSFINGLNTVNDVRFTKIGAEFTHIPSSRTLESQVLPNKDKLIKSIIRIIENE